MPPKSSHLAGLLFATDPEEEAVQVAAAFEASLEGISSGLAGLQVAGEPAPEAEPPQPAGQPPSSSQQAGDPAPEACINWEWHLAEQDGSADPPQFRPQPAGEPAPEDQEAEPAAPQPSQAQPAGKPDADPENHGSADSHPSRPQPAGDPCSATQLPDDQHLYVVWKAPIAEHIVGIHSGGMRAWRAILAAIGSYVYDRGDRLRRFENLSAASAAYARESERHGAPRVPHHHRW